MPVDDEYRKQVQGKVQDIISERREKPALRLVLEAVVEGVKLYRGYQEEKAAEEQRKRRRRGDHKSYIKDGIMSDSRKNGHGKSHESSGRRRHHRHRSRSRDEERGRRHRSPRDDGRSRSRHRHRDESRRKHYARSESQDRRPRSRRRREDSDVPDPVSEGPLDNNSEYQMTGGAGPVDTLHDGHRKPDALLPGRGARRGSSASGYQTSWQDLKSEQKKDPASGTEAPRPYRSARRPSKGLSRVRSHSRGRQDASQSGRKRSRTPHRRRHQKSRERSSSRRRDGQHDKQSNLRPGHVGASSSPIRRQKGPDGTPFGNLPERKRNDGFLKHAVKTYRHIEAEHEAGYRSKGRLEKALDEMRKKRATKVSSDTRTNGHTRERERIRKSEPERVRWVEQDSEKTRGNKGKLRVAETDARDHHRREDEERKRRKEDNRSRRKDADQEENQRSPIKPLQSSQIQPAAMVPRRPRYHDDQTTVSDATQSKPEQSCRTQSKGLMADEQQTPGTSSPRRSISTPSPVPEIRLEPPTPAGTPRRQPPPFDRELPPPPPNHTFPPVPGSPHWQHSLPHRPLTIHEETQEHEEILPQREPIGGGMDDGSEVGSAASYHDQALRSPMPESYEENDEVENEGYDQPKTYNETPHPDTPPSPVILPCLYALPSATESESSSVSSSPIMSHAPRVTSPSPQSMSAFLHRFQMPTPPTPPGSPPPAARPPNNTGMAALFGEIEGGRFELRKVADSEKREGDNNPAVGRVVYRETAHSHDVEEHERAQAREANNQSPFRGNSAWSTRLSMDDEDDMEPVPNRAFQNDLAKALQARGLGSGTDMSARGPRRGSDNSSLTADSRSSMIANVSVGVRDERAPVQQLSKSASGESLVFTLAAHIARPGWRFDGPSGDGQRQKRDEMKQDEMPQC